MPKLTTDILKNAMPEKGKRLEMRDDQEPGLIFRVTEKGVRTWSYRYRNAGGEHRRKAIGPFPAISLARAREEARKIKGTVAGGSDIVATERLSKEVERRKRLSTVSGLAEAYFADAALGTHRTNARAKRESTLTEEMRIFEKLIKPAMGKSSVSELTRHEIQAFVTKQTRKATSNGRHCRNVLRQMLNYAVRNGLIEANPAADIAVASPVVRERVLTDDELKAFWKACERPGSVEGLALSLEMGIALRMAAATLQRGGEVIGMEWAEIDENARTWLIPAERMKGKKPHLVPLSALAMELLAEAKEVIGAGRYVFQSGRVKDPKPMDRHALTRAMGRIVSALKWERATPHDLRRTGATNLTGERISVPRFVVSQVLAHSSDTGGSAAVTGIHYDRYDYLPEKRRALDAWADLLGQIALGRERPSNIEDLDRHRSNRPSVTA